MFLERETWHKRNSEGNIVGRRTQFPVILTYAVTVHKAQGQTLPAAVVHCSKEFVPGLICVAPSRVKTCAHLQVLHFAPKQLICPPEERFKICDRHTDIPINDQEFACCRLSVLSDSEVSVTEASYQELEGDDDSFCEEVDEVSKQLVKSYFERGDPEEVAIDLNTVYDILVDEQSQDFIRSPPSGFCYVLRD